MNDLISRQVVLDILKEKWNMFSSADDAMQESIDTIESLPSVTPARPKGKWKNTRPPYMSDSIVCSQCGYDSIADYSFCPNCGADMREEENNG